MQRNRGFTLLETVIILGITSFTIIVGIQAMRIHGRRPANSTPTNRTITGVNGLTLTIDRWGVVGSLQHAVSFQYDGDGKAVQLISATLVKYYPSCKDYGSAGTINRLQKGDFLRNDALQGNAESPVESFTDSGVQRIDTYYYAYLPSKPFCGALDPQSIAGDQFVSELTSDLKHYVDTLK